MATDIATLGIKVDATDADGAKVKLEQLAKAGDKAQASTKGLTGATNALNGNLASTTGAANAASASVSSIGGKATQAAGALNNASGAAGSMAERVNRLTASVDPLGAAQNRVNMELREASALYTSGAIDATQYANAVATLNARSTDLAARQVVLSARMKGVAGASRLTANEALNLSRQFADVGVTAAMGMNPLMILIQQGPQIGDIMKTSGLGFRDLGMEMLKFFKIVETVPTAQAAAAAATAAAAAATEAESIAKAEAVAATEALAAAEIRLARAKAVVSGGGSANLAALEAEVAVKAEAVAANEALTASNMGLAASGKEVGAETVTRLGFIGRLLPPLALIGGTVWLGFMAGARGANDSMKAVQAEFGFTDKQMDRLKDKNTELGYSFGDVWAGIKSVVSGVMEDIFGPTYLDTLSGYWNGFLDNVVSAVAEATKEILGSFLGVYHAVVNVWGLLPAAMGDLAIRAVNNMADAIVMIVNKSIDAINSLNDHIPAWLGGGGNVINFRAQANHADNPYGGAAGKAGDAIQQGMDEGASQASGIADRAVSRFNKGRSAHRRERLEDAAGDAEKGPKAKKPPKPKLSDEEKEYNSAVKAAESYIKALTAETEAIGLNELQTKRLATTRAQAEITTKAAATGSAVAIANAARLSAEMAKEQEAWEQSTANEKLRKLTETLHDQNAAIEFENSLIGMNNEAREKAQAQREIDLRLQQLERDGWKITPDLIQQETDKILANAAARGRRADASEAAARIATTMRDVADSVKEATASFGDLFGTAGQGFSDLLGVIVDFNAGQAESQQKLIDLQREYDEGRKNATDYEFERGRIQHQMAQAQVNNYGNMLHAAKGFFKEGSTGYKALEAAERAYRLFQFAMMVKEIIMDTVHTGTSVANSATRASANGVEAVAKAMASLPPPLNFIAAGAVVAFLVAMGVKMVGGHGGGGGKTASAAAEKTEAAYSGPRDAYGAPTSSYSVLSPGGTTVAANNNGAPAMGGGNGSFRGGDLVINGGADQRTIETLVPILQDWNKQTVQDARAAVAQDNAAKASRQRIGGSN